VKTFQKLVSLRPGAARAFGHLAEKYEKYAVVEPSQAKAGLKADKALVMSFYPHGSTGAIRLNLRWRGPHQVNDFKFDSLGEVQDYQTETEHTGWVTLQPHSDLHVELPFLGDGIPFAGLYYGTEFPLALTQSSQY
jgi:hypothetical protein